MFMSVYDGIQNNVYGTDVMLICMTPVVANLLEGPPIENSVGTTLMKIRLWTMKIRLWKFRL